MSVPEFKTEKVSDHITRIYAFSSELMYLVEGSERAALLDSGSGIGFVRPLIEQLTKKEVIVLLTHGHVDHAMGASEFPTENVYINQEDAYIYKEHGTYEFREDGLFLMERGGDQIVPAEDFTPLQSITAYNDLKEGDRFDLGGISVEMYACPGHTRGSMVMLIPEERTLLLGDACNGFTFVFEDYSTSLETYQKSLIRLETVLKGKYDTVLASHGDGRAVSDIIEENIRLCGRILERRDDKAPMEFRGHRGLIADTKAEPGHGNIVYHPDHLFED
ncbi:MAG: MBL fold metallo-hydrolase [Lachnospiraceae bacterium]|nr:MBL fold metallo-hydrolase [Lachnospiraceae bacterium]